METLEVRKLYGVDASKETAFDLSRVDPPPHHHPAKQRWFSLLLPARLSRETVSKLLTSGCFYQDCDVRLPAFCENLPAFPQIAGRERPVLCRSRTASRRAGSRASKYSCCA